MTLEFQKQDIFYLSIYKLANSQFKVTDETITGSNFHIESCLVLPSSQHVGATAATHPHTTSTASYLTTVDFYPYRHPY